MNRFVRIVSAMTIAAATVIVVHRILGLGPEFVGSGLGGVVDLGLFVVALLLVSLSDRELFWAVSLRRRRSKDRSDTAA